MDKWEYKIIDLSGLEDEIYTEGNVKFALHSMENSYASDVREDERKKRFEQWYYDERIKRREDKLNELGRQGWEFIQVEKDFHIFKRKLSDSE